MNPPALPQARKQPQVQNYPSQLLDDGENNSLYGLLGRKCVLQNFFNHCDEIPRLTLATGVAQVYLAKNPSTKWQKQCTGVCCFVKDNPKRSYFFRVYNLKSGKMLWEQEMYNQFKCLAPRPYFLTFEIDQCRAALNFANEKEASNFKKVVEGKAQQRVNKRQAKQNRTSSVKHSPLPKPPSSPGGTGTHVHSNTPHAPSTPLPPTPTTNFSRTPTTKESKKSKKDKKKKGKLSKADISMPSNFSHVNHVGFDPNKGIDMDPEIKDLVKTAGLSESQMQDKDTVEFIYDFIERRGGMEAVKKDKQIRSNKPEAPPPPPGRSGGHSAPPPPPSRPTGGSMSSPPPPPPQRVVKAPPPPSRAAQAGRQPPRQSPRPPPPSSSRNRPPPPPAAASPPSGGGPPPPPPPPPPPAADNIPPPPPPVGSGNLMSQIQEGTGLKSAGSRPAPAAAPPPSGRNALLEAIRKGKELKTVSNDSAAEKPAPAESEGGGGLADALADALRMREKVIQHDSDSNEDNDDDDDEWSD